MKILFLITFFIFTFGVFAQSNVFTTDSITGIKPNYLINSEVRVYPNPVHNVLHLTNSTAVAFEILNYTGNVFLGGPTRYEGLDMSSLAPGTYLLKITDGSKFGMLRFIKQ